MGTRGGLKDSLAPLDLLNTMHDTLGLAQHL